MSRSATQEYIGARRRAYADANKKHRRRILDDVCDTTGYERKYALKLLTGNRKFREHKGRGATYDETVRSALISVWQETGCICTTYLQLSMSRWVKDYEQHVRAISPGTREKLLAMSASTMDRLLKVVKRVKTGSIQRQRRNSANYMLKNSIPCASGEETMACLVQPGDMQADTFSLCGGDMNGSYFWILNSTDRKTQWTWLSPTWNRGERNTLKALKHIIRNIPFIILSLHHDNGGEILNYHLVRNLPHILPGCTLARSRPRHCNDNAHVEEKNRHVGRDLFGEMRLDCQDLEDDLIRLCDECSMFYNFCRPCKMLVSKEKHPHGKGFKCSYDRPRTPCERVLEEPSVPEATKDRLRAMRDSINGIELRHRIEKRLCRIIRRQKQYTAQMHEKAALYRDAAASGSSLRDAHSGTPPACDTPISIGGIDLSPKPKSQRHIKAKSVQYLTNLKQAYERKGVSPT